MSTEVHNSVKLIYSVEKFAVCVHLKMFKVMQGLCKVHP